MNILNEKPSVMQSYKHKDNHFIFSLESLAFSFYNNIFNLMPTCKIYWQNLKILTTKFKSTQFF